MNSVISVDDLDHMLMMPGYGDCVVGICRRIGQESIIAYDYEKVVRQVMTATLKSREQAVKYVEENMLGSNVGEHTPCFIHVEPDLR